MLCLVALQAGRYNYLKFEQMFYILDKAVFSKKYSKDFVCHHHSFQHGNTAGVESICHWYEASAPLYLFVLQMYLLE